MLYLTELMKEYCERAVDLKARIGVENFMEEYFKNHVDYLKPFMVAITKFYDKYVAFGLLRNCFGVCKISCLLGSTSPPSTRKGAMAIEL